MTRTTYQVTRPAAGAGVRDGFFNGLALAGFLVALAALYTASHAHLPTTPSAPASTTLPIATQVRITET